MEARSTRMCAWEGPASAAREAGSRRSSATSPTRCLRRSCGKPIPGWARGHSGGLRWDGSLSQAGFASYDPRGDAEIPGPRDRVRESPPRRGPTAEPPYGGVILVAVEAGASGAVVSGEEEWDGEKTEERSFDSLAGPRLRGRGDLSR